MHTLAIDIETYSSVDILKCGMYKYLESPDFEIMLFAYSYDNEPVQVIDLTDMEELPVKIMDALNNDDVLKTAWNAQFERRCIEKYFRIHLPIHQWECTMVKAAMLSLPLSLDAASKALQLENGKMAEGKALIRYFCVPCKPTKANEQRTRNYPHHAPEKWQRFKEYCAQDVVTERTIGGKIAFYQVPEIEKQLYTLDQQINDRGILIDPQLVKNAIRIDTEHRDRLTKEAIELTGLDNPNSVAQLKTWIGKEMDEEVESLNKKDIPAILAKTDNTVVQKVLELRQEMSKTSVKKYVAMHNAAGNDNRVRGLFQMCGASRTGRWCVTGDHEILTSKGWVRFDEWSGGVIACWSPSTEFISFQKAALLSFDYSGEMYLLESQRCSQFSTPDHRMPYLSKNGNWEVATVQELAKKRFSIPFTGRRLVNGSLEHLELRILIMVQADGHYTSDGDLRFHFSKLRKIERCKSLLRKAGLIFTTFEREKSTVLTIKSRNIPIWLRMFKEKVFGVWLLDEPADIVFDELENWDGYRCGPNSIQYCTTVKQNADFIQALAHLSGRAATIVIKNREGKWNTAYVVNIWLTPLGRNEIKTKPTKQNYTGKVYCAETNTGFFLIRRNGKVWVTGNSGRLVQVQNLPRNEMKDLELARTVVKSGDLECLEMMYNSVSDVLKQLIRTAFIAPEGRRLIAADFSAIEARVIAWLAGEKWRLDVFNTHGKIYEASAAQMFKVPIESITKGSDLRQRGKVSELALGYQGAVNALLKMGALEMGLKEEELPALVAMWRQANPMIVKFWNTCQQAAHEAVEFRTIVSVQYGIKFFMEKGILFIQLPSGRRLSYLKPKLKQGKYGPILTYEGMDQTTKKWGEQETYGGKLVENIVQATARDVLADAMLRLDKKSYIIVMHVHDEAVMDMANCRGSIDEVNEIMGQPIAWAKGLPLKAESIETMFYKKD